MSEMIIALLAMSLGCVSLGVVIVIAQEQGRIRKDIHAEKESRRKHAALSLVISLSDLEMDLEHVALEKNTTLPDIDKTMIEKSIRFFKETRLLYYPDLNTEVINNSELIINHIELWMAFPCYVETTPNVTLTLNSPTRYPYEIIEKEIEELDNILTSIYQD